MTRIFCIYQWRVKISLLIFHNLVFVVIREWKVHCLVHERYFRVLVIFAFLGCIFQSVSSMKLFSSCGSAAICYMLLGRITSLIPLKVCFSPFFLVFPYCLASIRHVLNIKNHLCINLSFWLVGSWHDIRVSITKLFSLEFDSCLPYSSKYNRIKRLNLSIG